MRFQTNYVYTACICNCKHDIMIWTWCYFSALSESQFLKPNENIFRSFTLYCRYYYWKYTCNQELYRGREVLMN